MVTGTSNSATVLDSATRELTRILLLFSLAGRLRPQNSTLGGLVDQWDFGRFEPHLRSGGALLPVPVLVERVAPEQLELPNGDHGLALASVDLMVLATPRGDVTLVMDCGFAGETDAGDIAAWLASTCFDRERIKLGGRSLPEVINQRLTPPTRLTFGQNVHQLVFPGGREQTVDVKTLNRDGNESGTMYWGGAVDNAARAAVIQFGRQFRSGVGMNPDQ